MTSYLTGNLCKNPAEFESNSMSLMSTLGPNLTSAQESAQTAVDVVQDTVGASYALKMAFTSSERTPLS